MIDLTFNMKKKFSSVFITTYHKWKLKVKIRIIVKISSTDHMILS